MNLPRTFVGIPRAFSHRALSELKFQCSNDIDSSGRELYFDDASDGIFTVATATTDTSAVDSEAPSTGIRIPAQAEVMVMDDEASMASDLSDDEDCIWC